MHASEETKRKAHVDMRITSCSTLKKYVCAHVFVDWIHGVCNRDQWRKLVKTIISSYCIKGREFPGSYLDGQLVKKSTAALNQVRGKPNVMIFIWNCVEISCLPTYHGPELRTCMVRAHSGTSCSKTGKAGFKCFGVFTVNRIWTCAVFTRAIWICSNQIQPRSSLSFPWNP